MAKKKETSIEEMLDQIKTLVERLEDDDVQLADSLSAFEQGIKLTREAQKTLAEAELHVQTLLETDGEPEAVPFSDEVSE